MRFVYTHPFSKRRPTHNCRPETCRRSLNCLFLFFFFFSAPQRENVRVVQQNIRPRHFQVPVEDPEVFQTLRGRTGEQSVTSPCSVESNRDPLRRRSRHGRLFFMIKCFLVCPPPPHTHINTFSFNDFLLFFFFVFVHT